MPNGLRVALPLAAAVLVIWLLAGERARAVSCGTKPPIPPGTCIANYRCSVEGLWEDVYAAAGTACNDGNACTYDDVCINSSGTCRGTSLSCTRPCEMCNGTATCAPRSAGSTSTCTSGNPCEAACNGASPYCQPL